MFGICMPRFTLTVKRLLVAEGAAVYAYAYAANKSVYSRRTGKGHNVSSEVKKGNSTYQRNF